jgi:hypothetical protein
MSTSVSIERRIVRPIVQGVLTFVLLLTGILAIAKPAQAYSDQKCAGGGFTTSYEMCFSINWDRKDGITRSQHIQTIRVWQPLHNDVPAYLEVWGDGFYQKVFATNKTFNIDRWVRSGTNVCAAADDDRNRRSPAQACFTIRV